MTTQETLLPCPFCGGEAFRADGGTCFVGCSSSTEECPVSPTVTTFGNADAVKFWNTRKPCDAGLREAIVSEISGIKWNDDPHVIADRIVAAISAIHDQGSGLEDTLKFVREEIRNCGSTLRDNTGVYWLVPDVVMIELRKALGEPTGNTRKPCDAGLRERVARALFIARSWQTARIGDWDDADEDEREPFYKLADAAIAYIQPCDAGLVERCTVPAFVPDTGDVTINAGDLRALIASIQPCDAGLREALTWFARKGDSLINDVSSAHSNRGAGASEWMREDDSDFRSELREAVEKARAAFHPLPRSTGMTDTPTLRETVVRDDLDNAPAGSIIWHCSDEDSGPDVGVSLKLGDTKMLWCGEITSNTYREAECTEPEGGWWLILYDGDLTRVIARCFDSAAALDLLETLGRYIRPATPSSSENNALAVSDRENPATLSAIHDQGSGREVAIACREIAPYLKWTISDESPGYHPTMPSAVGAFLHATKELRESVSIRRALSSQGGSE